LGNILTKEEQTKGYQLLFDGETLNGWSTTLYPEGWAVEDGAIVCQVKGDGYLYTLERYQDFQLELDYKTEQNVNSGIFFRWSDVNDPVNTGLEMQVLDTYHVEIPTKYDSGAVYELQEPSQNAVKPAGEWNHVKIKCLGDKITIHLNDVQVIDMDISEWNVAGQNPDGTPNKFTYAWNDLPRLGHIGLQDHGGRVMFKNIKILSL
jgi:hypothetical protein